jgi:DNA polymerase-3 subunit delta'
LSAVPDEPGRAIKIDAVRELIAKSVLAAQPDAYRACIVEPADALNKAAANALLKTLEEPTPRTVIILVSSHPDRLPATVRSRCRAVTFRLPPGDMAARWLVDAGIPVASAEACLRIAGGAPLRAQEAAEHDWPGADRALGRELALLKARQVNPLEIVEKWQQRSIGSVTDGLKRICHALAGAGLGASTTGPGAGLDEAELQRLSENIDWRGLFGFVDALTDTDRAATHNANETMMLEHLVNRWLALTRPGGR